MGISRVESGSGPQGRLKRPFWRSRVGKTPEFFRPMVSRANHTQISIKSETAAMDEEQPYGVKWEGGEDVEEALNTLKSGKALAKFSNGDTYDGEYSDGKRNGRGKYTWSNPSNNDEEDEEEKKPRSVYRGSYKHGKREGKGTARFADGGEYRGEWKEGEKSGKGVYFYPNGDSYIGYWSKDKKHGDGIYMFSECKSVLKGDWRDGKMVSGIWKLHDQSQTPYNPPQ
ncbi:hypothetical protein AAMO2058_001360600 [Amorphochlora amoebiformis]